MQCSAWGATAAHVGQEQGICALQPLYSAASNTVHYALSTFSSVQCEQCSAALCTAHGAEREYQGDMKGVRGRREGRRRKKRRKQKRRRKMRRKKRRR